MKRKLRRIILMVFTDIVLTGLGLCIFALFHHVLPRKYQVNSAELIYTAPTNKTNPTSKSQETNDDITPDTSSEDGKSADASGEGAGSEDASGEAGKSADASGEGAGSEDASDEDGKSADASGESAGSEDASGENDKSADASGEGNKSPDEEAPVEDSLLRNTDGIFTDGKVIQTDTVYQSNDISVTTTTYSGRNLTYYVQDIYIRNIENLKTAFAKDTYGKNISEWPLTIATKHDAVASINGDYYGIHEEGIVIRNGYVYRTEPDDNNDVCVIYWDGTMEVLSADEVDVQKLIDDGCYQAWSFGPGLLNADYSAKTRFYSSVARANPRSAIGYYEPGHYCFVAVDGRYENGSKGVTLAELASIMEELGCKAAYNLDGGKSSAMTFDDQLVNTPCDGGRKDTDIIYIGEVQE